MRLKKIVAFFIVILLVSTYSFDSALATDWKPLKQDASHNFVVNVVGVNDVSDSLPTGSLLQFNRPNSTGYIPVACEKFGDAVCSPGRLKQLQAGFIFPLCETEIQSWCIKNFEVQTDSKSSSTTTFLKYVSGSTFDGNDEISLPKGGTVSIWKYVDLQSGSEQLFAVRIRGAAIWTSGKPFFFQTVANIYPIKMIVGSQYLPDKYTQTDQGISQIIGPKCNDAVFTDLGECASRSDFMGGLRFSLAFKVPNFITGFISGRLQEASISSSASDADNKIVKVSASPMKVPRLGVSLSKSQADEIFPQMGALSSLNYRSGDTSDGLKIINQLRPIAGDVSSGFQNIWSFTIMDSTNDGNPIKGVDLAGNPRIDYSSKCDIPRTQLLGFVGTNAMVFDPGIPNFVNDEFVYSVAGMHFEPDGKTPYLGSYKLQISKALASCLYKNLLVPVRALVHIISADGVDQAILTESIKIDGDYYSIDISGFTFSIPTIRVKLEYGTVGKVPPLPEPVTANSSPIAQPKTEKPKSVVLVCVKGKVTKRILGVKPTCPTGYKKK